MDAFTIMAVTIFILANFLCLQFLQSESSIQTVRNILLSEWGVWKSETSHFRTLDQIMGGYTPKGAIPLMPNQTPRYPAHISIAELKPHQLEIA
jgi:hypothetical protein